MTAQPVEQQTFGVPELAALLGLSRTNVHYWLRRAGIKLHRLGNRVYAYADEVPEILAAVRKARAETLEGLTVAEAAQRAGVTAQTIYSLIRMSRIAAAREGRKVRVLEASLEAYLRKRQS